MENKRLMGLYNGHWLGSKRCYALSIKELFICWNHKTFVNNGKKQSLSSNFCAFSIIWLEPA